MMVIFLDSLYQFHRDLPVIYTNVQDSNNSKLIVNKNSKKKKKEKVVKIYVENRQPTNSKKPTVSKLSKTNGYQQQSQTNSQQQQWIQTNSAQPRETIGAKLVKTTVTV